MIKSIFARPVFINPQAYLVIPLLANLSMLEPIDFTSTNTYSFESLGKVESKIISAKDEYILHIDLYESYDSCVLGEFYIGPATIGSIDDFTITTNGYITTIEVGGGDSGNIVYPGLIAAWSAKGKTNDDEDRAILKDLTGNGHDITLNRFAFSEMSGYGGYKLKGNYWTPQKIEDGSYINTKTSMSYIPSEDGTQLFNGGDFLNEGDVVSMKITGIPEGGIVQFGYGETIWIKADKDGIYKGSYIKNVNNTCNIGTTNCVGSRITIEWLPEYPDALVFDGVDDYGINENMPILTDYTIIAKRKFINDGKGALLSKSDDTRSAFVFEGGDSFITKIWSFGVGNNIDVISDDISYMTTLSYNGISLKKGTITDTNKILLGGYRYWQGAFYSAYLFDRSLDEQEIKAFIRKYIDPEYLLPSEIPTPDCYYDFSLGSNDDENRETIKDQSGNGNDAKAYNIAWAGMSGYGGYNWNFNAFLRNKWEHTDSKIILDYNNKPTQNSNVFEHGYKPFNSIKGAQIKVSGIKNGSVINFYNLLNGADSSIVEVNNILIESDGIYSIPDIIISDESNVSISYYGFNSITIKEGDVITIEQIPLYPGALVLDGTDDYIALEAFTSGFKTIFILCSWKTENMINYDQRNNNTDYENALNISDNDINYCGRNRSGKTYINGILNTKVKNNLTKNKKHLITSILLGGSNTTTPYIASDHSGNNHFSKLTLYKFLGFKEELTEEQIQAIIKKYNLLDGVDEIEVS